MNLPPPQGPRRPIGQMPFRRRHDGLSALERREEQQLLATAVSLLGIVALSPLLIQPIILALAIAILTKAAAMRVIIWNPLPAVDRANYDRDVDSFSPDKCWHFFRFRKPDLDNLIRRLQLPQRLMIKGVDNGFVSGTFAALVLFYRLRYPGTLEDNLSEFGCDYSKLSKIFNSCLDFLYDRHAYKVLLNIAWYSDRFDMYNEV